MDSGCPLAYFGFYIMLQIDTISNEIELIFM